MKIATLNADVTSHGVRGETRVTSEANATSFYAQISGLATDKIGYPIRELSSNAWDAAGGNFDVTLPTPLNPVFSIRDRGPGLSHTFMNERFTVMYHSDKRDSMDKLGGWGLGRFSAFAYLLSDESTGFYLINSWHEGVKTSYVMSLGEDGTPVLKTMHMEESNEPSGLEVTFSVAAKDIETFHEKAREILWAFPQRPTITPPIEFQDFEPVIRSAGWSVMPEGSPIAQPMIRLGCVMYPINLSHPGVENPAPGMISRSSRILFETDIDSVQPTLSREGLEYKSRTIQTINRKLQIFVEEIQDQIQRQIDGAATLFEADSILWRATTGFSSTQLETLRAMVNWRGRAIPNLIRPNEARRITLLGRGWSAVTTIAFDGSSILTPAACHGFRVVIEHTVGQSIAKLRAAGLEGQPVMWIRCRLGDREAVLNELGITGDVLNLGDFKIEAERARPKTIRRRSLMLFRATGSSGRVTMEIDLSEPRYYLNIERSRYQTTIAGLNGREFNLTALDSAVTKAYQLGLLTGVTYVCPLKMDNDTVPENWTNFADYLCRVLLPHLPPNDGTNWANYHLSQFPDMIHPLRGMPKAPFQKIGGELGLSLAKFHVIANSTNERYVGTYGARAANTGSIFHILSDLGAITTEGTVRDVIQAIDEEAKALKARYPLLTYILTANRWGISRGGYSIPEALAEYERLLVQDGKAPKGAALVRPTRESLGIPQAPVVRGQVRPDA